MKLLRTWTVENAAIAIADQQRLNPYAANALRAAMSDAVLAGELNPRVTPEQVNAWIVSRAVSGDPDLWRVEDHLKYRDTSEVSRYLQGGKEVDEIAQIIGWPVEDVQAVADARKG